MIDIWFEVHAQTDHNVANLASGHYDVALTAHGRAQAHTVLRARYSHLHFDVVFTSDTQRAYDTACLIFADRPLPILRDPRLRECDYGDFEGRPRAEMERARLTALHTPFPNGESYAQVAIRMQSFLTQLAAERDGQHVMLVGHGASMSPPSPECPSAAPDGPAPQHADAFELGRQDGRKGRVREARVTD